MQGKTKLNVMVADQCVKTWIHPSPEKGGGGQFLPADECMGEGAPLSHRPFFQAQPLNGE